ncbi:MAG: TlyA family RNA methyltransferase [Chloroflexi bacterium]|nr:TlyA family RNA methyltransferase [Chloroflexota bacterium]
MQRIRLDHLLVERGFADSRSKAQALIMAGQVRVEGQVILKPATAVHLDCSITVDSGPRFVSRGGDKLQAALERFSIDVRYRICADVGASTGGFTDCLLQHGAAKVYAIDVGKGILHWKLRNDTRVIVMEETNARSVERLPEPISLGSVDASFISLKILLPVMRNWLAKDADVISLIKPQFEAGRRQVSRGDGVIRDPHIHRQVLMEILAFSQQAGYSLHGLIQSPILGPKGNAEFLLWLRTISSGKSTEELVEQVFLENSR